MALELEVTTPQHVKANYHRVANFEVNLIERRLTVNVVVYLNEAVRRSDAQPLAVYSFSWQGNDWPLTATGNTLQEIYAALRRLPAWKDAKDVL